jgi:N-acetylglucosamine transport system substrate-binding protein
MSPTTNPTRPPASPTRRDVLRTAAAAGLAPLLAGCVTGSSGDDGDSSPRDVSSGANPLGVPATAALDVVIFKGGYGDEYARQAEAVYQKRYPQSKISHQGIQNVGQALQPRFVAGDPPDVVDNTGAGRLDLATLVKSRQLADLGELLDAPALDTPGKKVRETLLPGVVEDGTLDGRCRTLNLAYTVWGLWYSKPLFAKHGWTYPATWAEMLTLCETIKKAGIAPWTYQGKFPEYINDPLLTMAAKTGGMDLVKAVDNLEPGAWKHPALTGAAQALHELAGRGYLMPGSAALSHTEAQAAWCQGKAALIPCGSWLEAEQQGVTPPGFDMALGTVPALTGADRLPVAAVQAGSSESFLVPARAKNPRGGMEYLRVLFSAASARNFAKAASTMPSVVGATDGLTLSSGLASVRDAVAAAQGTTVGYRFRTWYAPLAKAVDDATGELVNRRLTPPQWSDRIQRAADRVARDANVVKYRR